MSDESSPKPINWREIAHQLQEGAYEEAAARLWETQLAGQQTGDAVTAAIAAAIRQICLACQECQTKIAEQQQALSETVQREAELRSHAQAILARMAASSPAAPLEAVAVVDHPVPMTTETMVSVWTRLWIFLRKLWGLTTLLPDTPPAPPSTPLPSVDIDAVDEPNSPAAEMSVAPSPVATASDSVGAEDIGSISDSVVTATPVTVAALDAETLPAMSAVPRVDELVPEISTAVATELDRDTHALQPDLQAEEQAADAAGAPSLVVYCLGSFQVYQDDQFIDDWPSSKGQLIFKYLLLHRERPVAKEFLMDLFWPEAPPDAARNNLNVAIYGLRRALRRGRPDFSHVLFQHDCYLLNPDMAMWVDVEKFTQQVTTGQRLEQAGQLETAIQAYRAAEALYQGEFLAEDRYEDWPLPHRQRLQDDYFKLLDRLSQYYLEQQNYDLCVAMGNKLLAADPCQEDAHRRLMHCYHQQGQTHLALRQYHRCVEALARELDVGPSQSTEELYARIRRQ